MRVWLGQVAVQEHIWYPDAKTFVITNYPSSMQGYGSLCICDLIALYGTLRGQ